MMNAILLSIYRTVWFYRDFTVIYFFTFRRFYFLTAYQISRSQSRSVFLSVARWTYFFFLYQFYEPVKALSSLSILFSIPDQTNKWYSSNPDISLSLSLSTSPNLYFRLSLQLQSFQFLSLSLRLGTYSNFYVVTLNDLWQQQSPSFFGKWQRWR